MKALIFLNIWKSVPDVPNVIKILLFGIFGRKTNKNGLTDGMLNIAKAMNVLIGIVGDYQKATSQKQKNPTKDFQIILRDGLRRGRKMKEQKGGKVSRKGLVFLCLGEPVVKPVVENEQHYVTITFDRKLTTPELRELLKKFQEALDEVLDGE